jgi:hypothetical protein
MTVAKDNKQIIKIRVVCSRIGSSASRFCFLPNEMGTLLITCTLRFLLVARLQV